MSYHHGAVRVAQYYLCSHVDELVHEEESALEHLLMEQYAAACLRCHHNENRKKVWRQSGPRSVCERHYCAVNERVDLIMFLSGNDDVVAFRLKTYAQTAEGVGNDAQIAQRHVLYTYSVAHHGSHSNERAYFYHVGQNAVGRTVERLDSHDGNVV